MVTKNDVIKELYFKSLEENVSLDDFKKYVYAILNIYSDTFGLLDKDKLEFKKYFSVVKSPKDKDVLYHLSILVNKLNKS